MADRKKLAKSDLSADCDIDVDAEQGGPVVGEHFMQGHNVCEILSSKEINVTAKDSLYRVTGSSLVSVQMSKASKTQDSVHGTITKTDLRNRKASNDSIIDSGILSFGSIGSNHESISREDKNPVQCSDGTEDDEVLRKLGSFHIRSTRDEGFEDFKSTDNEQVCVSATESENDEIEIDLYQRDEDGDTILHVAICSLYLELSLMLIELAESVDCLNLQNSLLQSPLHLAVLTNQVEIVKTLVNRGVDVTLRDQQGNTPLHIACRKGDKDSVALLVQSFGKNKAQRVKYFSMKNCEGLTCLHIAAQEKQFIILGHLFAKGADVNIGDAKSGRTMLHCAVEKKDIETVSLLLTHPEIDVDCKTFKGETPIVMAYWRNYQDIVKKLKSKGAFFSYDLVEESDEESLT